MGKSIETIWKNGFLKSERMTVPKITQFYNAKSKLSIEKEEKKMKFSAYLMLPLGASMIILNYITGNDLIWGIISAALIIPWTFIGLHQVKNISQINYQDNCYDYLKAYQKKRCDIERFNRNLGLLSIPLTLIPIIVYTCVKKPDESLGKMIGIDGLDISNWFLFLLVPIMLVISYAVSTYIIKRVRRKDPISKLISDMDELRKE